MAFFVSYNTTSKPIKCAGCAVKIDVGALRLGRTGGGTTDSTTYRHMAAACIGKKTALNVLDSCDGMHHDLTGFEYLQDADIDTVIDSVNDASTIVDEKKPKPANQPKAAKHAYNFFCSSEREHEGRVELRLQMLELLCWDRARRSGGWLLARHRHWRRLLCRRRRKNLHGRRLRHELLRCWPSSSSSAHACTRRLRWCLLCRAIHHRRRGRLLHLLNRAVCRSRRLRGGLASSDRRRWRVAVVAVVWLNNPLHNNRRLRHDGHGHGHRRRRLVRLRRRRLR